MAASYLAASVEMTDVKQRLRSLEATSARSRPLHFAGRTDIIEKVLLLAANPPPKGAEGSTVLISGAPGAGKTALIRHIERLLLKEGAGTVMRTEVPDSTRMVESVYREIANHLCGLAPESARATKTKRVEGSAGVPGTASVRGSEETSVPPPVFESVHDVMALRAGVDLPADKRVVVFVDETQNIEPGGAAEKLMRDLHTQGVAPVLLVCAGLSNSRGKLRNAKLSRVDNVVHLGPLSRDEAHEAVLRTLEKVGKELCIPSAPEPLDRLAVMIARESDGWPMHIHNYLRGVWRLLLEQPTPSLDAVDVAKAIAFSRVFRDEYYEDRIDAADAPIEIIDALLRETVRGEQPGRPQLSRHAAESLIEKVVDALEEGIDKTRARRLVGTGEACFERMLRAGVVSLDRKGRCVAPVPSLSSYILKECQLMRASAAAPDKGIVAQDAV